MGEGDCGIESNLEDENLIADGLRTRTIVPNGEEEMPPGPLSSDPYPQGDDPGPQIQSQARPIEDLPGDPVPGPRPTSVADLPPNLRHQMSKVTPTSTEEGIKATQGTDSSVTGQAAQGADLGTQTTTSSEG